MENTTKIDLLVRSKIAKTIFSAHPEDTLDLRASCIAEIEYLRTARVAARQAAEARLEIAQRELQKIRATYNAALQKVHEISLELSALAGDPPEQAYFEKILQKTAPPEVAIFLKDLVQLEERAMASYRPCGSSHVENDDCAQGDQDLTTHSNAASISACVIAIRRAREKVNAMLTQAQIEDEMIATLNKLRASILRIHPSCQRAADDS